MRVGAPAADRGAPPPHPTSYAMSDAVYTSTVRRRTTALATARLVVMVGAAWVVLGIRGDHASTVFTSAEPPPGWGRPPDALGVAVLRPVVPPSSHASALSAHLAGRHVARMASLRASAPPIDTGLLSYPRNLRRIYDGHWQVDSAASTPFREVPLPPAPSPAPGTPAARLTGNGTDSRFGFASRKGFALLSMQNHATTIEDINVVTGELLLRDGPYRSNLDVTLRVVGAYEWRTGFIVGVGDTLSENVSVVLDKLYSAMKKHPNGQQMDAFGNITSQKLVEEFTPALERNRKKEPVQRAPSKHSVPVLCPFVVTLNIQQDNYNDKPPSAPNYAPLGNQGTPDIAPQLVPGLRYATRPDTTLSQGAAVTRVANDVSVPVHSRIRQDQVVAQEEMVKMSGLFISKKCNTQMEIELSTMDAERLFVKAINYTLLVTVVAFTQVIVLIRQMEMTSTQAGASRVSLMTVGLQAVADSYLCLGHLTLGIAVQSLFNAFATAAFFKFICFSIFLMRWMLLIWKARRPSGFSEGWEAMRRELSMLYSRFYGSLLFGLFLLYQLHDHMRIFIFALYSFWVPQIILNIVEDHRRPLLPMYIIGTSITRLAIPLYFWGCPKNFLHIQPLPSTAAALVGWMAVQALILLSQYKFGPRWFIPKALLPEKYDYYRPIVVEDDSDDDIEAQNIKGENAALVSPSESRRECCICMEVVVVNSRERMVTPCNHFFHAQCLERWLEVRLECALCRRAVPPP